MKSFDDVINGNVNEGLAEKWIDRFNSAERGNKDIYIDANIGFMLIDIMKKLEDMEEQINSLTHNRD